METSSFLREARLAFEYSLGNFLYQQAVFFAERLVAEFPCDETGYLLALAYYHNQEISRSYSHLQGNKALDARYLLARCCFQLNKWEEAEDALQMAPGNLTEVANGPAGLYLLGQVKEKQSKRDAAIECYSKSLELCPFMWSAYERWSWLSLSVPTANRSGNLAATTFSDEKFSQSFANLTSMGGMPGLPNGPSTPGMLNAATGLNNLSSPPPAALQALQQAGQPPATRAPFEKIIPQPLTPGIRSAQNVPPRSKDRDPLHAPRKERRADPPRALSGNSPPGGWARDQKEQIQRRVPTSPEGRSGDAEVSLASLLGILGNALHALHDFETEQTLQCLSTTPRRHYETGYVLDLVGRCAFESADYKKAEQMYQQVQRVEKRKTEGLEHYSSALWHLRKDVELGHLAQQCLQRDRLKPQVWCVVGNCFSLQKEHDTAIKFFKRAIQVDPSFTYAYTLCGHEFVANEKFDKAIPMYEQAIAVDSRHYNAWWGLGNIYLRQEEYENARYHFLKALEINKNNSVLRCYLGMVLESLNNPLMALEYFDRATQGEPQNGMAFFQKACVLMSLERYDEALGDLKKVRCLAPKEACVHFQLGKVYMKLQKDKKALLHFNIAMDLNKDSKDYHTIKTHIERLHIRGVTQSEMDSGRRSSGGRLSNSSSSTAGGDDRSDLPRFGSVGAERADSAVFVGAGPSSSGSPHSSGSQRPSSGASYVPQHYTAAGGSPSGRPPDVTGGGQQQNATTTARGPYGTSVGRGLWGGRGGPGAFHAGRGGSPQQAWGGAPNATGPPGPPYHGTTTGFRI